MAVFKNSRYATAIQLSVEDKRRNGARDKNYLYTYDRISPDVEIAEIYTVQGGDRLDQLAYRFGGDSQLWWVIAEVNEIFGYPLSLEPGLKLRIPVRRVFDNITRGVR